MYGLRIILGEKDAKSRHYLKRLLLKEGFDVVGEGEDGYAAMQLTFKLRPDLLIICSELPGSDGLEVARKIAEKRIAPVIVMCPSTRKAEVKKLMVRLGIYYLFRPIDELNIIPMIENVVMFERRLKELEAEKDKLTRSLNDRKLIEQAKGLLVERRGLTEQQAFKLLQKTSMDKCIPIVNVATKVIRKLQGDTQDSTVG